MERTSCSHASAGALRRYLAPAALGGSENAFGVSDACERINLFSADSDYSTTYTTSAFHRMGPDSMGNALMRA